MTASRSQRFCRTFNTLLAFPAGRHDDQVDSTAQALAWAKQRPVCTTGMIDYWRRLAEEG